MMQKGTTIELGSQISFWISMKEVKQFCEQQNYWKRVPVDLGPMIHLSIVQKCKSSLSFLSKWEKIKKIMSVWMLWYLMTAELLINSCIWMTVFPEHAAP